MSFFGEQLREQRLEAEVGVRELARALNISHALIVEVERGTKVSLAEHHYSNLVEALGYDHPSFWLEWWKRVAAYAKFEQTQAFKLLPENEALRVKYFLLEHWRNQQIASGTFDDY